jgi:hypothetical protein
MIRPSDRNLRYKTTHWGFKMHSPDLEDAGLLLALTESMFSIYMGQLYDVGTGIPRNVIKLLEV